MNSTDFISRTEIFAKWELDREPEVPVAVGFMTKSHDPFQDNLFKTAEPLELTEYGMRKHIASLAATLASSLLTAEASGMNANELAKYFDECATKSLALLQGTKAVTVKVPAEPKNPSQN